VPSLSACEAILALLHLFSIKDREWGIWKNMAIQEKGEKSTSHMFMPNGGQINHAAFVVLPSGEIANSFPPQKTIS